MDATIARAAVATPANLPSNKLIRDMATASVMASPPTFGTRVTGLTTGTEAANTTIASSARVVPNYDAPRSDGIYRITGAYSRLNASGGIDVGAFQTTTPAGAVGPTACYGTAATEFVGRYLEWWGRDTAAATQYLTMWVSKNGGPFHPHVNPDTPQAFPPVGDGLHFLQPIDMGAVATWRIIMEGEGFTFGGFRKATTDTLRFPSWDARRLLVFSDSYNATGASQRVASGFAAKLARSLGLELHLTAVGGTGVSARNADPTNYFNYGGRIPADVTPFFSSSDQPAAILIHGSINDFLLGFAGATFDADIDTLLSTLQTNYPNSLLLLTHPMHPYRGDSSANTGDAGIGTQMDTAAAARGLSVPYDGVSAIPLTGTGYAGHVVGDGNSDTFSASDHQHPLPAGSTAIAAGVAVYFNSKKLADRPFTSVSVPTIGYGTGQAAPGNGRAAASGYASLDSGAVVPKAQLPPSWGVYRTIKDLGCIELTGLNTGTYVLLGGTPTTPGSAVAAAAAGSGRSLIHIDPAAQAVTGLTESIRLAVEAACNATAPLSTFTISLVLASALSGAGAPSAALGAALTNPVSAAIAAPGANSKTVAGSGAVTYPASNTFYMVQLVISVANMAAGAYVELFPRLEAVNG